MLVDNPAELRPWTIVSDNATQDSLAVWRIAASAGGSSTGGQIGELAIAIFSSQATADRYRQAHGSTDARVVRLDEVQTLQALLAGYQQGIRYAALDPDANAARQIFVLRDVLKGAQQKILNDSKRPA